ncbi:peptidyl-alpha-hydroxyglycine alpha-amidating lyase 2-like isoform X1 [Bemisia tabaci]|uniref:peptidyl-alpha-hydroxyglycine alpha-amidating lyase 2 isoform X1 n=1 Tax=Bemisia tabaci TaxID=7038 RepID=UPI003B284329
MGVHSTWLIYLSYLLCTVPTESSRVRDSFYSSLKYLLGRGPDLPDTQESFGVSSITEVGNWPIRSIQHLGQISGISVNPAGQPVIFHRGPKIWDSGSFNESNYFQEGTEEPIRVDTVITLDAETGNILSSWGGGIFFLPHGIHVDFEGNIWLTDVALHQVFKFSLGARRPLLTIGKRFKPGSDFGHLCKPTSVAVASDGHIFIADGYCNSRILKFNHFGDLERVFPQNEEFVSLKVPHSITLLEKQNLLCIADRENMRIVCVNPEMDHSVVRTQHSIQQADLGRVFAVANSGQDDMIYAINGPTSPNLPVQGFTIEPLSGRIIHRWEPTSDAFHQPHDAAVSPDGLYLYVCELQPIRLWKFKL